MTKTAKHFKNDPEITEPIVIDEYTSMGYEPYSDAGSVTRQATRRGMSKAAIFAVSGVVTSVLLAGAVFLSSPVRRTTAVAETPAVTQTVDAKAKGEAEAKETEVAKTEAEIAKNEKAKAEAEAQAKKEEEERAKAEAEAKAAEERAAASAAAAEKAEAKVAEPHTAGESVTIALPTADADVYAEWQKDSNGNWWACFSTYNGTAVQAIPAQDGGWLFYAVTDSGLVQIQRVNESTIEGENGPAGTSSHWTDVATNTVWY